MCFSTEEQTLVSCSPGTTESYLGPELLRSQLPCAKLHVQTGRLHALIVGVLQVIYYYLQSTDLQLITGADRSI